MPPRATPTLVSDTEPAGRWHPVPALWSWFVPGLGHYMLGQKRRGILIAVGVLGMWLLGLLVGGIGSIDSEKHRAWYFGQALFAPSLAVNYYRHSLGPQDRPSVSPRHDYEPSFGRPNEQGVLFTALAGMLNALVIIDVIYRDPTDPRHQLPQPRGTT